MSQTKLQVHVQKPEEREKFKDSSMVEWEYFTDLGFLSSSIGFAGMTSCQSFGHWEEDTEETTYPDWWQEKTLIERIRDIILQVDNEPNVMFSTDLLVDLGAHTKIAPTELQDMSKSLDQFLDDYAVRKCGVHMGNRTRTFLKNELIYLTLRFRKNTI